MRAAPLLTFILLASGVAPAWADVAFTYVLKGDACVPEPAEIYVHASQLRFESRAHGARNGALIDASEQLVTYFDHERRQYMQLEIDADQADYQHDVAASSVKYMDKELAKAQRELDAQCAAMKQQGMACLNLAQMGLGAGGMDPQALQAMATQIGTPANGGHGAPNEEQMQALVRAMQQPSAGGGTASARVGRPGSNTGGPAATAPSSNAIDHVSGAKERVAGLACEIVERRQGEVLIERRCEAAIADLNLDAKDAQGLERAMRQMMAYGESFAPIVKRFAGASATEQRQHGLVLSQTCYSGGRETGAATVRVSRERVGAARFEVPDGYQPMAQGVGGRD